MKFNPFFPFLFPLFTIGSSQAVSENNNNATATTTLKPIIPKDNLVLLKFDLKEETIPGIVTYILNNSVAEKNITVEDVIKLTKLEDFTLNKTIEVLNYFNKSNSEIFTIDTLEIVLDSLGWTYPNFQDKLLAALNLQMETVNDAIVKLNIDLVKYITLVYTNQYIYDLLRNGTYADENVNNALTVIDRTKEQVFQGAKEVILQRATQLNSTYIMDLLKERGLNRRMSLTFWSVLNITTEDVNKVEKFKTILNNITMDLNENLTMAVPVAQNKLAIHEDVYSLSAVLEPVVKILASTGQEVASKSGRRLGRKILELQLASSIDNFVEIATDYENIGNCTYVTVVNGAIIEEEVEVQAHASSARKNNGTLFNFGSPLFCKNRVYGLAKAEEDDLILFDIFYHTHNDNENEEEDHSHSSSLRLLYNSLMVISMVSFIYFL